MRRPSPATGAARTGSLRTRLVVGVLLLTALGLALAATAATLLLRGYLVGQVDAQLVGGARFALTGPARPVTPGQPALDRADQLPSPFVLTFLDASGAVLSQQRGSQVSGAPAPDLTGLTLEEVVARASVPFDLTGSGDSAYSYRAVAVALADGSGSVVLALSTEPIDDTTARAVIASLAVGLITLGLVGLLAGGVVRVGLRPLEDVELTAERIAAGDLTQRVPDLAPGTEIGRLSRSLNGMLTQIETAFDESRASEDRLRRFVADASHELRTPLTTIRGYAELSRSGALPTEADRARAVLRIEQEALRMGVLVDDLLLLARLDQQRPLESRPVDVVEVVLAAAEGLRAAAPQRQVTVAAPESAVVLGDALRLRQVLDNIATNTRVHTPARTPVSFVVEAGAGEVVVRIHDAGPGMDVVDTARAFERFYRGDPSRSRGTGGGSGLGLSIAQAIVTAQGGVLGLESSSATGTTVTVRLPAIAAAAPTRTEPASVGAPAG